MTIYICFVIAMIFIYIIELLNGGFKLKEFLAYFIMMALLGAHVYFTTRKKALWGIIVPTFIVVSFYPVNKLINPVGVENIVLIGLYLIVFILTLFIWYKARESIK